MTTPLSEQWPEVYKLAKSIAHDACMRINSITPENNPQIKKDIKGCEYWRQGLLEMLIEDLECRV